MNNIALLRKIMIALLAIATVILVIMVISRTMQNNSNNANTPAIPAQEPTVEVKSAPEIITEQKFSTISVNEDGFLGELVEVPVGGILQVTNDTDRDIMFDIRAENYIAGLTVGSGQTGFSPVFTQEGEYTISEIVEEEINEEFSAKVIVK